MNFSHGFALALVSLLFFSAMPASAAAAKPKAKSKSANSGPILDPSPLQEISIPMAHGQLDAEVEAVHAQHERANAPRTQVEIGASTWKPNRATTASRISNATDFQTKGIPSLEAGIFSPILGRQLQMEFGLGLLAMQRTGSLSSSGVSIAVDQNAYVTMLRIGATYSPWLLFGDTVTPYASAAMLPSMILTRASSFDDGVNDTGLPFEFGAGTLIKIFRPASLDLGVSQVLGRVQDSDFKGFAVRAGLRMPI